MSLLLLLDRKLPQVGVVQWFKRDPRFTVNYPCGPLLEMTMGEFRQRGYDLVLSHFEEYDRIRIAQNEAKPVLVDVDEKLYLKQQRPVMISKNSATGEVHVSPLHFRKYSLGGLRSYDKEYCTILPVGFTTEQFWKAFDAALAETS